MTRTALLTLVLLGSLAGSLRGDMLKISGPTDLGPGMTSTYVFQFVATSPVTIEAFDLVLGYDHLKVALSNIRLTTDTQGEFATTVNSSLSDRLIFSASANSLGLGVALGSTTSLMAMDVLLLPGATGTTDLNLLMNVATTFTSVNESLPLDPAPTNGFDPGVDLRITAAVPEPGAWGLLLAGLAGVMAWRRTHESSKDTSRIEILE